MWILPEIIYYLWHPLALLYMHVTIHFVMFHYGDSHLQIGDVFLTLRNIGDLTRVPRVVDGGLRRSFGHGIDLIFVPSVGVVWGGGVKDQSLAISSHIRIYTVQVIKLYWLINGT